MILRSYIRIKSEVRNGVFPEIFHKCAKKEVIIYDKKSQVYSSYAEE